MLFTFPALSFCPCGHLVCAAKQGATSMLSLTESAQVATDSHNLCVSPGQAGNPPPVPHLLYRYTLWPYSSQRLIGFTLLKKDQVSYVVYFKGRKHSDKISFKK